MQMDTVHPLLNATNRSVPFVKTLLWIFSNKMFLRKALLLGYFGWLHERILHYTHFVAS
jgi:hypothetical protein